MFNWLNKLFRSLAPVRTTPTIQAFIDYSNDKALTIAVCDMLELEILESREL